MGTNMTMSGMKRGPFCWNCFWRGMLVLAVMGGCLAALIKAAQHYWL